MPQILRTTLVQDEAQAIAGSPSYDLPVNPLSVILLTVKALNNTVTIGNYSAIDDLLSLITTIRVAYRGANIIHGSLTDLAVLNGLLTEWMPGQSNKVEADNDVRSLTVPICFGRRPYDAKECFPATKRGDLTLQLDTVITANGLDTLVLQIETIELLDAAPTAFLKYTTISKLHNATGDADIELPIGNELLGMLLQGPVVPTGASYNASFGKTRLQIDNVETVYSETNWESLHGELMRKMRAWPERPHVHGLTADAHTHTISGSGAAPAAYAQGNTLGLSADANGATLTTGTAARTGITGIQNATVTGTTREQQEDYSLLDNYAYLDLDPLQDDSYALKTAGAARVNLRVNVETASADPMRVLPVELIRIAGAQA